MIYYELGGPSFRSLLIVTMIALAAVLFLPAQVDGQKPRKGFVLNLGLGPSMTRMEGVSDFGDAGDAETKAGIGSDFKIGHAPTDQILIYYSNDLSFMSYSGNQFIGDYILVSGVSAIGATFFTKPVAPSPYVSAGIGIAALSAIDSEGDQFGSSTGLGITLGGGFEFARHFLLDGDIVIGRPRDSGVGTNAMSFKLNVIWLLY